MARCAECGREYGDTLEECPDCSTGVERAIVCERCGERFRGTDSCPACGLAIEPIPCERHPTVLADGRCVICGRAICEECRGNPNDRRVHLCEDHASVFVISGWAQVHEDAHEFEAHLIRDNLRAEGIDARVFSQKDLMFSVDLGDLSVVRILVPAWDYERAMALIHERPDEDVGGLSGDA
jgi:hypothetical protein